MSAIRTLTGGREFDRNFGPGQYITDLSELQHTALVASGMAVFVEGAATALPSSGQIPITSVQFRYPAQFGFQAVNGRLFLFEGIEYAGDGSGLVRVTPLPETPGGSGGGDASAANQSTQITLAGTANTRLSEIDAAIDAIGAKTPALDNAKTPTVPSMTTGGNLSAQTTTLGNTYQPFASQACKQMTISNQTGTMIEVQQGGSGVGYQIPTGAMMPFFGLTNANQLGVKRADNGTTQVTVTARWES
jgi:hypothetical protein